MNIIFGMDVIRNTGGFEGGVYFEGSRIEAASPSDALRLGIGMVHQEFKLIDEFSITENIKLNKEICKPSILTKPFHGMLDQLDKPAMGRESREALDRVHQGEILGIAGLAGSGKLSISNGIRGIYGTRGEVYYKGERLDTKKTKKTLQKGVAFVSEDRKKVGLILEDSIELNCIYASMVAKDRFLNRVLGVKTLNKAEWAKKVDELIELLEIKCVDRHQKVGALSGGNQQKVCIASMLLQEPDMFFASEPTRGIDIGAKQLILDYIRKLNRENNVTVVVTSSELHELRAICDRIAVIADGKLAGILPADAPMENFGLLMSNISDAQ